MESPDSYELVAGARRYRASKLAKMETIPASVRELTDAESLAEKIGRSEKYVYARSRLTHLVEEVQQAFYNGKLSVAHAFEMARLAPNDQRRALLECFPNHRTAAAIL